MDALRPAPGADLTDAKTRRDAIRGVIQGIERVTREEAYAVVEGGVLALAAAKTGLQSSLWSSMWADNEDMDK